MTPSLYFVSIIERALMQPDPEAALLDAFAEIEQFGQQPALRVGYEQYAHFMMIAARRLAGQIESLSHATIREQIVELAFDQFIGTDAGGDRVSALLDKVPGGRAEYECYESAQGALFGPLHLAEILILRDGETLTSIDLNEDASSRSIPNILPGQYTICLQTGRVLWQGDISARDLHWTLAFPNQPLTLAASTSDTAATPSREIEVLAGELIVQVYPGLDSGRLEFEASPFGGSPR